MLSRKFLEVVENANINWDVDLSELILREDLPQLIQFQAFLGLGKTRQAVRVIVDSITTRSYNKRIIYTSLRILEVLEVLMNIRKILVNEKGSNTSYFLSKIFIKLTKENADEAKSIILTSKTWDREDKRFLEKILSSLDSSISSRMNKGTIKKMFSSRVIISTHASLPTIKSIIGVKEASKYIWVCDELLYHHLTTDGCVLERHDGFNKIVDFVNNKQTESRLVGEFKQQTILFEVGILTYSIKNNIRFIHMNRDNGFARTIVMSASKAKSEALNLIKDEEYIKIVSPKKNAELMRQGLNKVDSVNGMTGDVTLEMMLESASNFNINDFDLTDTLVIAPKSKHIGLGMEIKLDMTGTNSFSSFKSVFIKDSFNFPREIEIELEKALGDKATEVLNNIKSEMMTQSLYRCCVRKGEAFDLILGSTEAVRMFVNAFKA